MSIDKAKYEYFLVKYRTLNQDELNELAARGGSLIEEAQLALKEVCAPSGLSVANDTLDETPRRPTTPEEIAIDKSRSSELWNGALAKRVEHLFVAQAVMFSFALLGPQGLKMGALPLVVVAGALSFALQKAGRAFTRNVCANVEVSIEKKTNSLRTTSYILWPALLLSSVLGVTCASLVRSA